LTSEQAVRVGSGVPRFELAPHNCFACGTLNEHGLHLVLHVEPSRSWCDLTLDRRFEGWEGIAHGGVECTILDEVMAWALVGADNWGLTARLSVDFRRPIEIGRAVRAEGWITRSRRRVVETAGRIIDPADGTRLATASGTYVAADDARKQAMRERYGFRLVESGNERAGKAG
jgi:acyl-coenzyme A thioesterase PaaI-like protein